MKREVLLGESHGTVPEIGNAAVIASIRPRKESGFNVSNRFSCGSVA